MVPSPLILNYIQTQRRAGYNDYVIRSALLQAGHKPEDVDEALTSMRPKSIASSPDVSPPMRYAGFWIRLLALFLDILWTMAASIGVLFALLTMAGLSFLALADPSAFSKISLYYSSYNVLLFVVIILLEAYAGGTPGKLILGLRIVNKKGKRLGFFRALWRYVMRLFGMSLFGIGGFLVAFTKKKTGLHDMAAGTFVIKK